MSKQQTQPEKQIIITTGLGTEYEEKHFINLCDAEELLTIKNMMDDIDGDDDETIDIPIGVISSPTMKKIISFCDNNRDETETETNPAETETNPAKTETETNPVETETETNPAVTETETKEKNMVRDNEITEKNKDFMNIPLDELYDLLVGSNFLNYPKLLKVCEKTIAKLITNKSTTDIVSMFGVKGTLCVK